MTLISTLALALAAAQGAAAAPPPAAAPDYAQDSAWLCRPGRADPCAAPQDVTVIAANGQRRIERFKVAANPQFDCFYVYPTVSSDTTPNSDMTAGDEENRVATAQAARFSAHCRVFAPLYRQVTLTALRAAMTGQPMAADRALALADVTAAWNSYLARDNKGRGVVLIGHSQGSGVLKALIPAAIEGRPIQKQIISAMLIGTNVAVPAGREVGGDLRSMPLCRSAGQFGCVVTYVTFRQDKTPPANSRFGKVPQPGMVAGCTNPAALLEDKGANRGAGGDRAASDAIFITEGAGASATPQGSWVADGKPVTTPFVRVPGLISTQCVAQGGFDYLAVTVNADPADPRTDTVAGDVNAGGRVLADWGLHLIDMPVAMGNLVALADMQAAAWRKAGSGKR